MRFTSLPRSLNDRGISEMLSMTRANLSKHLLAFERGSNLPPTLGQERLSTRVACSYPHCGTADKSHTKTWFRRFYSSLSHIDKLCERLPVSEWSEGPGTPTWPPSTFRLQELGSTLRGQPSRGFSNFGVTFVTLSRAINRSNGDWLQVGQAAVATRRRSVRMGPISG